MVNKSNRSLPAINGDASNDIRAVFPRADILQSITVNNSIILDVKPFLRVNVTYNLLLRLLKSVLLGIV